MDEESQKAEDSNKDNGETKPGNAGGDGNNTPVASQVPMVRIKAVTVVVVPTQVTPVTVVGRAGTNVHIIGLMKPRQCITTRYMRQLISITTR